MEENEQYLVAVHSLEEALNKDLHNSVVEHNQNENPTDDHIKNILDDLRSATDRFTKAENKQKDTSTNTELSVMEVAADTKSLESCDSRRSATRDTVSIEFTPSTLRQEPGKYSKIYPILSPTPSQTEAHDRHPVCPVCVVRIHQLKNRMLALERIEASIKKNMRRL